mmetsp:Transcript_25336/g.73336  ORF Transcript_25336/g.73336 Transcript_25336/m.73336 type:complete len:147 (-) Transcript_25336:28-468(-)
MYQTQSDAKTRSTTPRRSSNAGAGHKKDLNPSSHSPPSKLAAPTKEALKPIAPKQDLTKVQPRPPPTKPAVAPRQTHQQILSDARLARQKKQTARQHGFTGVWLLMANAGKLDEEELSPEDKECVHSWDAAIAIGSAIRQVLPKSA